MQVKDFSLDRVLELKRKLNKFSLSIICISIAPRCGLAWCGSQLRTPNSGQTDNERADASQTGGCSNIRHQTSNKMSFCNTTLVIKKLKHSPLGNPALIPTQTAGFYDEVTENQIRCM